MPRPDYFVCNDGELCDDCRSGKPSACGECPYCTHELIHKRVWPFENPDIVDEEALHLLLGADYDSKDEK